MIGLISLFDGCVCSDNIRYRFAVVDVNFTSLREVNSLILSKLFAILLQLVCWEYNSNCDSWDYYNFLSESVSYNFSQCI